MPWTYSACDLLQPAMPKDIGVGCCPFSHFQRSIPPLTEIRQPVRAAVQPAMARVVLWEGSPRSLPISVTRPYVVQFLTLITAQTTPPP